MQVLSEQRANCRDLKQLRDQTGNEAFLDVRDMAEPEECCRQETNDKALH